MARPNLGLRERLLPRLLITSSGVLMGVRACMLNGQCSVSLSSEGASWSRMKLSLDGLVWALLCISLERVFIFNPPPQCSRKCGASEDFEFCVCILTLPGISHQLVCFTVAFANLLLICKFHNNQIIMTFSSLMTCGGTARMPLH